MKAKFENRNDRDRTKIDVITKPLVWCMRRPAAAVEKAAPCPSKNASPAVISVEMNAVEPEWSTPPRHPVGTPSPAGISCPQIEDVHQVPPNKAIEQFVLAVGMIVHTTRTNRCLPRCTAPPSLLEVFRAPRSRLGRPPSISRASFSKSIPGYLRCGRSRCGSYG